MLAHTNPPSHHQHDHWRSLIFFLLGLRVENHNLQRQTETPECMWDILVLSSSAPLLHDGEGKIIIIIRQSHE